MDRTINKLSQYTGVKGTKMELKSYTHPVGQGHVALQHIPQYANGRTHTDTIFLRVMDNGKVYPKINDAEYFVDVSEPEDFLRFMRDQVHYPYSIESDQSLDEKQETLQRFLQNTSFEGALGTKVEQSGNTIVVTNIPIPGAKFSIPPKREVVEFVVGRDGVIHPMHKGHIDTRYDASNMEELRTYLHYELLNRPVRVRTKEQKEREEQAEKKVLELCIDELNTISTIGVTSIDVDRAKKTVTLTRTLRAPTGRTTKPHVTFALKAKNAGNERYEVRPVRIHEDEPPGSGLMYQHDISTADKFKVFIQDQFPDYSREVLTVEEKETYDRAQEEKLRIANDYLRKLDGGVAGLEPTEIKVDHKNRRVVLSKTLKPAIGSKETKTLEIGIEVSADGKVHPRHNAVIFNNVDLDTPSDFVQFIREYFRYYRVTTREEKERMDAEEAEKKKKIDECIKRIEPKLDAMDNVRARQEGNDLVVEWKFVLPTGSQDNIPTKIKFFTDEFDDVRTDIQRYGLAEHVDPSDTDAFIKFLKQISVIP